MTAEVHAEQISVEAAAKAAGLAIETGNAGVNGVTIYYRDIGPRAEPVILLHGFPETGDTFARAIATLGKRYRLVGLREEDACDRCQRVDGSAPDRPGPCHRPRYRRPRRLCVWRPISRAIAEPHGGRGVHRGPRGHRRIQTVCANQSADPALRAFRTRRRSLERVSGQSRGAGGLLHELSLEKPQVHRRRRNALHRVSWA